MARRIEARFTGQDPLHHTVHLRADCVCGHTREELARAALLPRRETRVVVGSALVDLEHVDELRHARRVRKIDAAERAPLVDRFTGLGAVASRVRRHHVVTIEFPKSAKNGGLANERH